MLKTAPQTERLTTGSFDFSQLVSVSFSALPKHKTDLGAIFQMDCLELLKNIKDNSFDTVFADPPFNLKKVYGANCTDDLPENIYVQWCEEWIEECVRVLKPGGSLFIYNLPKWNIMFGPLLAQLKMNFRHWIAISTSNSLPINGRLYPAHYSMIYYTKGKPNTFRKIRTPIDTCRHCDGEIKDYGGHRKAMNPNGVNLKDIWVNIPPVRHKKFMHSGRKANALSTKLLERVVHMSTNKGDLVFDPFGGSGTTFAVCEKLGRRWMGAEIDFADAIADRLTSDTIAFHQNNDYVEYD